MKPTGRGLRRAWEAAPFAAVIASVIASVIAWAIAPLSAAFAQDNPAPPPATGVAVPLSALSSVELWLAVAIICFGFVVLGMQYALLRRTEHTEPEDVLRLFTVTIIIIGTLALIAIGYSSQQIAPALGLFGTILGYLLGKSDERTRGRRAAQQARGTGQQDDGRP